LRGRQAAKERFEEVQVQRVNPVSSQVERFIGIFFCFFFGVERISEKKIGVRNTGGKTLVLLWVGLEFHIALCGGFRMSEDFQSNVHILLYKVSIIIIK